MSTQGPIPKLKLLPYHHYRGNRRDDPLRFYYWPLIGILYRRRVELCLAQCTGGQRVLEVGFGSGATFLNLCDLYQEIHGLDLHAPVDEVARVFETRHIRVHLRKGSILSMPYHGAYFDTVLLISILEHLKPDEQDKAFSEISRILKPGGQVVYGVPVERPLMEWMFRCLGYNIREHHFSTEKDVFRAAARSLEKVKIVEMRGAPSLLGPIYVVGHFRKDTSPMH